MKTKSALICAAIVCGGLMVGAIRNETDAHATAPLPVSSPSEIRAAQHPDGEVHGVLLADHNMGAALIAWDDHGAPIITVPVDDKTVNQLKMLSRSPHCPLGVFYDATFVVGPRSSIPASQIGSEAGGTRALMMEIVSAQPTRLSDRELRKLLKEVDLGAADVCRASTDGKVHRVSPAL